MTAQHNGVNTLTTSLIAGHGRYFDLINDRNALNVWKKSDCKLKLNTNVQVLHNILRWKKKLKKKKKKKDKKKIKKNIKISKKK